MCMPKEEAKTLVERLVESMDRLTQAVERMEQRLPHPPLVMHTHHSYTTELDERGAS